MSPDGALVGWILDKMWFCVSSADGDAPAFPIVSCLSPRDSRDTTGLRGEPKDTENIHPCPRSCPGALEDIAFVHYQTARLCLTRVKSSSSVELVWHQQVSSINPATFWVLIIYSFTRIAADLHQLALTCRILICRPVRRSRKCSRLILSTPVVSDGTVKSRDC